MSGDISLVDRAATRIPFRVLKRDKESKMGIDLTTVFKSDDTGGETTRLCLGGLCPEG